ncbi:hypothetical protein [uncultured Cohaesibacter sp.]|uniref:hypothetical protein n=1 Tax=uncultured Cohaesibacter sp. TaxID=1002546 RepID=UPI0029C8438C|nr:hypothetical protein [uncultured Cohaesibacter sp.]
MIASTRLLSLSQTPITALCLLVALSVVDARAEDCADRFKALLVSGNGDEGSVKIDVTQEIVGGMTSRNYSYQVAPDHWMTEMIEPAGQWTLAYDNVMYSSIDEGKSWSKVREMDSDANAEASKKAMRESAETTTNAACGEEEFEGIAYQTVEADFVAKLGMEMQNHHKYWVHPETGFIRKAFYHMKAAQFESKTTQLIEKAPDLQLPTPK